MDESLGDFIAALERAGELKRIRAQVSPVLEIGEVADRVSKSPCAHPPSKAAHRSDPGHAHLGGHALLFENVAGSGFPVLINAFGSYRRVEMALGCEEGGSGGGLDQLADRIGRLTRPEPPASLMDKIRRVPELIALSRLPPRRVRRGGRGGRGGCQEVIWQGDEVDLTRLPMLRCWPMDGDYAGLGYPAGVNDGIEGFGSGPEWEQKHRGRYITLGGVYTIHPDDEGRRRIPPSLNVGVYRVQLMGRRVMAMHWHMHHDGARHWRAWKERGRPMPVAIAFGGPSVLPYAATAPMPPGMSELLLAGFLQRRPVRVVRGVTVPIDVPASAEIVIEGMVSTEAGPPGWDPREPDAGPLGPGAAFEGPFGDHTGFYSLPDRYPIMTATALTHRRGAVFPATIVGPPPQEDYFLGKATERLFLPLVRTIIPDVIDYDLPMFGAFHNCVFVKIRKEYPLHARRVMCSIWGAGQMAWTKHIFVVDEDVDVHDHAAVLRRCAQLCRPGRDVQTVFGPLDILDHAAPWLGAGSKRGYDCTRKVAGEQIEPGGAGAAGGVGGTAGEASVQPRALPDDAQGARGLERIRTLPSVVDAALHAGWCFVSTDRPEERWLTELGRLVCGVWGGAAGGAPPFVVLVDEAVRVGDLDEAMFHFCANTDTARDAAVEPDARGPIEIIKAVRKGPGYAAGLPVRDWPPYLVMSEEVRKRVDGRMASLGVG